MSGENHRNKMKEHSLNAYSKKLKKIRLIGKELQLSEGEIDSVMESHLQSLATKRKRALIEEKELWKKASKYISKTYMFFKSIILLSMYILVTILFLYLLLQYKPIQYFIQSKLQDFIYPGMKILRKMFLPIIYIYPSLTNFYDESCLVSNPFFKVPNMPCPCEDVRAILNLTGEDTKYEVFHSGIPFMIKSDKDEISWTNLRSLYYNHSAVFDRDASHLVITSSSSSSDQRIWSSPASLFAVEWDVNDSTREHTHIIWRCNRMEPTRLLRNTFGTPVGEPNYAAGVTIEKLVVLDGPKVPSYRLPATDGTTVFIQQSSGSRIIVLTPANECKEKCLTLSVELPPKHILWFSWWYWRASSLPTPGARSLSITYVGSYL